MEVKEAENPNLAPDNSGYKIYFGKDNEISVDCARVMTPEFCKRLLEMKGKEVRKEVRQ